MDIMALRLALTNNELGQTISTIELLAQRGCYTMELDNLKTELGLELNSRRITELIHKAQEEQEKIIAQFNDWFDLSVVYEALMDALIEADQAPTLEAIKDLWEHCCYDICDWVKGSIKED